MLKAGVDEVLLVVTPDDISVRSAERAVQVMEAKKITDRSQLNKGTFGILEPSADAETIPVEEIDFAVVPCVTCNKIGQRLGHGGGFYDRYLEGAEMDCALVCREETMTAAIPTETHDKKFDLIVTERHIFRK